MSISMYMYSSLVLVLYDEKHNLKRIVSNNVSMVQEITAQPNIYLKMTTFCLAKSE